MTRGALHWGIKASLREYVAGPASGQVIVEDTVVDGVPDLYDFEHAGSDFDPSGPRGTIRYRGSLKLTGHFGMPIAALIDPWVEFQDGRQVLSFVRWEGREVRLDAFVLDDLVQDANGELHTFTARTTLTADGVELFGSTYEVGTEFDRVAFSFAA
jgi:hypothetical protein